LTPPALREETELNSTVKQLLIVVFVAAGVLVLWNFLGKNMSNPHEATPSFSDMLAQAEDGKVKDVTIDGNVLTGHFTNSDQFRTTIPSNYPNMYDTLRTHGVNITIRDQNSNFWVSTLISIAPFAVLLGLWFFLLRKLQPKSKATTPQ
jgi:cell division protease FtsH